MSARRSCPLKTDQECKPTCAWFIDGLNVCAVTGLALSGYMLTDVIENLEGIKKRLDGIEQGLQGFGINHDRGGDNMQQERSCSLKT